MATIEWMGSALAFALVACGGAQTSQELSTARDSYQAALDSDAARLAPEVLHDARQALVAAERADDGSDGELHQAYLAIRKADLAQSVARARRADDVRARALATRETELRRRAARAEAARTRALSEQAKVEQELAAVRGELQAQGALVDERTQALRQREAELEAQQRQLDEARGARIAAERRYDAAMRELEQVATVQEEPRGVKITLSGQMLFPSGVAELQPVATQRLDQVAEALRETDKEIVIEGHTDARGAAAYNRQLSKARAEAVRTYLISQGVAPERIIAIGMGESQPLVDNRTPEGRANNRRVEIIVRGQRQAAR